MRSEPASLVGGRAGRVFCNSCHAGFLGCLRSRTRRKLGIVDSGQACHTQSVYKWPNKYVKCSSWNWVFSTDKIASTYLSTMTLNKGAKSRWCRLGQWASFCVESFSPVIDGRDVVGRLESTLSLRSVELLESRCAVNTS